MSFFTIFFSMDSFSEQLPFSSGSYAFLLIGNWTYLLQCASLQVGGPSPPLLFVDFSPDGKIPATQCDAVVLFFFTVQKPPFSPPPLLAVVLFSHRESVLCASTLPLAAQFFPRRGASLFLSALPHRSFFSFSACVQSSRKKALVSTSSSAPVSLLTCGIPGLLKAILHTQASQPLPPLQGDLVFLVMIDSWKTPPFRLPDDRVTEFPKKKAFFARHGAFFCLLAPACAFSESKRPLESPHLEEPTQTRRNRPPHPAIVFSDAASVVKDLIIKTPLSFDEPKALRPSTQIVFPLSVAIFFSQ